MQRNYGASKCFYFSVINAFNDTIDLPVVAFLARYKILCLLLAVKCGIIKVELIVGKKNAEKISFLTHTIFNFKTVLKLTNMTLFFP